ncbi:MAG TPA: hypothetical protein VFT22_01475 [Kofleriaceae bacterium]|nr:hypothetical protein [Kofleriaceae bacterium]
MVARLEHAATGEPLGGILTECTEEIESYLELQRDGGDRDELVAVARDDLRRLGRLLMIVDHADVPFVMRQIRRVLGRFDFCAAP